jgi:hypothetical protein
VGVVPEQTAVAGDQEEPLPAIQRLLTETEIPEAPAQVPLEEQEAHRLQYTRAQIKQLAVLEVLAAVEGRQDHLERQDRDNQ